MVRPSPFAKVDTRTSKCRERLHELKLTFSTHAGTRRSRATSPRATSARRPTSSSATTRRARRRSTSVRHSFPRTSHSTVENVADDVDDAQTGPWRATSRCTPLRPTRTPLSFRTTFPRATPSASLSLSAEHTSKPEALIRLPCDAASLSSSARPATSRRASRSSATSSPRTRPAPSRSRSPTRPRARRRARRRRRRPRAARRRRRALRPATTARRTRAFRASSTSSGCVACVVPRRARRASTTERRAEARQDRAQQLGCVRLERRERRVDLVRRRLERALSSSPFPPLRPSRPFSSSMNPLPRRAVHILAPSSPFSKLADPLAPGAQHRHFWSRFEAAA